MKNIARLSALVLCAALSLGTMTACEQKKVVEKPAAEAPKADDAKTPAAEVKTPEVKKVEVNVNAPAKVEVKTDEKGMPAAVKVDTKAVKVDTTDAVKKVEVKAPTTQSK